MFPTGFIPARGTLGAPPEPSVKAVGIPAPVAGINAVDNLAALDPSFCLDAVNLIADGRTMKVRPGYQEYATSIGAGAGVRTIIPFEAGTTANNELFAVTKEGIYEITAGGAIGAAEVALSNATNTGWGVWTTFVSDAGTHYSFYADETDGLFRRAEADTWAAVTDITGVTETTLVFVMQFKGRLWFVERDTGSAWYLATGAISGAATEFNFGNKFNHGGKLVGLYSWTVDGGEGIDDHLVAVSTSGDVMVYKGTDPSSVATWELVGQYYIGVPPAGRRIAKQQGGDLYLVSQYGIIPLTRLLQGALVQQEDAQLTRNIAPLIADTLFSTRATLGWSMCNVPEHNVFLVTTPKVTGENWLQYCLSTRTQGWTQWESMPINCGEVYLGEFYIGNETDVVYKTDVNQDNIAAAGTGGTDITFNLLTSFQEHGEIGMYHRIMFIRPVFLTGGSPGANLEARYDYDMNAASASDSAATVSGLATWDVSLWDVAIWGSALVTLERVGSAQGIGRAMAVAMSGSSNTETGLIRIDTLFDTGGYL